MAQLGSSSARLASGAVPKGSQHTASANTIEHGVRASSEVSFRSILAAWFRYQEFISQRAARESIASLGGGLSLRALSTPQIGSGYIRHVLKELRAAGEVSCVRRGRNAVRKRRSDQIRQYVANGV